MYNIPSWGENNVPSLRGQSGPSLEPASPQLEMSEVFSLFDHLQPDISLVIFTPAVACISYARDELFTNTSRYSRQPQINCQLIKLLILQKVNRANSFQPFDIHYNLLWSGFPQRLGNHKSWIMKFGHGNVMEYEQLLKCYELMDPYDQ